MEYKGYHAAVSYDDEDSLFIGNVIGISDHIAFHGASVDELKDHFQNAVDEYLAFCKEVGKNPDREYKGTFNVRIDPELHRKLSLKAAITKSSLNSAVEAAIRQYVS